jgi:hypothetical protein
LGIGILEFGHLGIGQTRFVGTYKLACFLFSQFSEYWEIRSPPLLFNQIGGEQAMLPIPSVRAFGPSVPMVPSNADHIPFEHVNLVDIFRLEIPNRLHFMG